MNSYKTIFEGGSGEIIEKKSRFIATINYAETEAEALAFIEQKRKQYWDARHNCYAYIVGTDSCIPRCSDDGEPSKTAGFPMLDVLQGDGLYNVVAVVTRYFGGTLLGTGGLVRAYQLAVREGLNNCRIIERQLQNDLMIETDYNGLGKLQYIAAQLGVHIYDTSYSDKVVIKLTAADIPAAQLSKQLSEATSGRAVITRLGTRCCGEMDGKLLFFES